MQFNLEKARELFRKNKTRFCNTKDTHIKLLKWLDTHDFIELQNRPVWVVPHEYVGDKIAIRPHGLIFISEYVPKNFVSVIVFHELTEEGLAPIMGKDKAHKRAILEEYRFLKKRGLLPEGMGFLKNLFPDLYDERVNLWRSEGLQI